MKTEKGKQVFKENIDDILANKIIEHTESNSEDTSPYNKGKIEKSEDCFDNESCGKISSALLWSLVIIGMLAFVTLLLKGKKELEL